MLPRAAPASKSGAGPTSPAGGRERLRALSRRDPPRLYRNRTPVAYRYRQPAGNSRATPAFAVARRLLLGHRETTNARLSPNVCGSPSSPSPPSWRSASSSVRAPPATARRPPRRRRGRGAAPVPVTLAPVEKKDVPVWLEGLGTVAAWQQVTRARAGRRPARQGALQRGAGGQEGRPAGADRSAPVRGAAALRPRARWRATRAQLHDAQDQPRALPRRCAAEADRAAAGRRSGGAGRAGRGRGAASTRRRSRPRKLNLDYARVTSPIDGVTGVRLVDAGQPRARHRRQRARGGHAARSDRGVRHAAARTMLPRRDGGDGARRRCRSRPGAATARTQARRRARSSSSTTRSTRRRRRCKLKASSPTPSASCGPISSSRRACCSTTRKDALVVPAVGGAARAAGHLRLRGRAPTARREQRPVEVALTVGRRGRHRQGARRRASSVVIEGQNQLRPGLDAAAARRRRRRRRRRHAPRRRRHREAQRGSAP